MAKLGVNVQVIAGGEIYQALQTGAIDAAEWVGPYDDLNLGFAEVAQNYYYPGWWEAGPTLEVQINKAEWDGLPEHYQNVIQAAAFKAERDHDGAVRQAERRITRPVRRKPVCRSARIRTRS